jgi:hypothetical protein
VTQKIEIGKNVTDSDKVSQTYKEYMEARLAETMAEARRHHQSYIEIREQYNAFIDGRINSMINTVLGTEATATTGNQSSRYSNTPKMNTLKA